MLYRKIENVISDYFAADTDKVLVVTGKITYIPVYLAMFFDNRLYSAAPVII